MQSVVGPTEGALVTRGAAAVVIAPPLEVEEAAGDEGSTIVAPVAPVSAVMIGDALARATNAVARMLTKTLYILVIFRDENDLLSWNAECQCTLSVYISHAAHIRIPTVEILMVKTRNEEGKERSAYILIVRL